MTLALLAAAALVSTVALLLRRRRARQRARDQSLTPVVLVRSGVRVLRTEDEIRSVAIQARDREERLANAAAQRAARLNALVRPSP